MHVNPFETSAITTEDQPPPLSDLQIAPGTLAPKGPPAPDVPDRPATPMGPGWTPFSVQAPATSPLPPLPGAPQAPQPPTPQNTPTNPTTIYDPIADERSQLEQAVIKVSSDRSLSKEQKDQVLQNLEKRSLALNETQYRRGQSEQTALATRWAKYMDDVRGVQKPSADQINSGAAQSIQQLMPNLQAFSQKADAFLPGLGAVLTQEANTLAKRSGQYAKRDTTGAISADDAAATEKSWKKVQAIQDFVSATERHAEFATKETEAGATEARRRLMALRAAPNQVAGSYAPQGFVVVDRQAGVIADTTTGQQFPAISVNNQMFPVTDQFTAERSLRPGQTYIDSTTYQITSSPTEGRQQETQHAGASGGGGGQKNSGGGSEKGSAQEQTQSERLGKAPGIKDAIEEIRNDRYMQAMTAYQSRKAMLQSSSGQEQFMKQYEDTHRKAIEASGGAVDAKKLTAEAWAALTEAQGDGQPVKDLSIDAHASMKEIEAKATEMRAKHAEMLKIEAKIIGVDGREPPPTENPQRFIPTSEETPDFPKNGSVPLELAPAPNAITDGPIIVAARFGTGRGDFIVQPLDLAGIVNMPERTKMVDFITGRTVSSEYANSLSGRRLPRGRIIQSSPALSERVREWAALSAHDANAQLQNVSRRVVAEQWPTMAPKDRDLAVQGIQDYLLSIRRWLAMPTGDES